MHEYNPYVRKVKDKERYLEKLFLAGKIIGHERATNYEYPVDVICKETFILNLIPYLDLVASYNTYEKACSVICDSQKRDKDSYCATTVAIFECTYAEHDTQYVITKVRKDIKRGRQFSLDDVIVKDKKHVFAAVKRTDINRLENYDELDDLLYHSKVLSKKRWVGNNRQDANIELAELTKMCNNDIDLCEDIDINCVCNSDNKYLHRQYGEYIY